MCRRRKRGQNSKTNDRETWGTASRNKSYEKRTNEWKEDENEDEARKVKESKMEKRRKEQETKTEERREKAELKRK